MKSYVWAVDSALVPHLRGNKGVSASYLMPLSFMPSDPESLAGSRLWIVLRSTRGAYLFAKLQVEMVELFDDGINAGDYCLTVDVSKSFMCSREIGLNTYLTRGVAVGLEEADEETDALMIDLVGRNVAVKLQEFPDALLNKVEDPLLIGGLSSKARSMIAATTVELCLDELWGAGRTIKMPPFANFAYRWLLKYRPEEASQDMRAALCDLDPTIIVGLSQNSPFGYQQPEKESAPVTDIQLTRIEPDKVFARRFVAKQPICIDCNNSVEKTEHSEKKHQDMLRDIASRLLFLGLNPLQSSSIDLLLQIQEDTLLFELKSSNRNNLYGQCAKGLFQLGSYSCALKASGYKNVRHFLIVETSGLQDLDAYADRALASFNVVVFFYYPEKSWPQRVSSKGGFLEAVVVG